MLKCAHFAASAPDRPVKSGTAMKNRVTLRMLHRHIHHRLDDESRMSWIYFIGLFDGSSRFSIDLLCGFLSFSNGDRLVLFCLLDGLCWQKIYAWTHRQNQVRTIKFLLKKHWDGCCVISYFISKLAKARS